MDPYFIALLLYFAALILAILDIFLPSGGVLMVLAVAAAFASILFGFRSSTTMGMAMLTVVAASIPICALLAVKIWPHTPIGRRIILRAPTHTVSESAAHETVLDHLVGQVFRTETALLPAGQIKVGHRRLNAIAESGIIETGQNVKVMAVRERNLIVRMTRDPLTLQPQAEVETSAASAKNPPPNLLDLPADQLGLDSIDE